ncbi:unnamed protein product, partial [marine sediment metagenome]
DSKVGFKVGLGGNDIVGPVNVYDSVFYDNLQGGFHFHADADGPALVERCIAYGHTGVDDYGFQLDGSLGEAGFDRQINSSIAYNNYEGIHLYQYNFNADMELYNNTIYGSEYGIYIETHGSQNRPLGHELYNNIFSDSEYGLFCENETDA